MTCSWDKLFVETWTSTKVFKLPFSYVKFYFVPCSSTLPHDSSLFLFIWIFLKEPKFCSKKFQNPSLVGKLVHTTHTKRWFLLLFLSWLFFLSCKVLTPSRRCERTFFFYTPIINNILFGYNGMVPTTHYDHCTMRGQTNQSLG